MAKFCYNCGNPIKEGDMFCSNCSAKLDSPARVQPEQTRTQFYSAPNNQSPRQPQQSQRVENPAQSSGSKESMVAEPIYMYASRRTFTGLR